MDSGNSGSLQSSSGGDDEFDSRGGGGVDSSPLSALLRPTPSPSAAGAFSLHGSLYGFQDLTSAPPPPPPHQHQQQQAAPWSAQFTAGALSSSSSRVAMADAGMGMGAGAGAHQAADPSATTAQGTGAAPPAPPRGSRKRTRASRRAPTTVLTTDTSNFRAMVQEFTGIPSPPFAAGAGAPAASLRARFDHLFPSPSTLRSAAGAAADPASSLPPYLLRPFAQKLPTTPSPFPPFTSSSSSNIGLANADATTATATATAASANPTATAGDAFQLTSSALLRMQDPNSYLTFQNLLGSTQPSSQPMFGGFAQAAPRLHEPSPSEFLAGVGVGSGRIGLALGGLMVSEGLHLHPRNDVHHGGDELSGVVAGGAPGNGSCKLNYTSRAGASSSSAAASAAKAPDGAAGAPARPARGEGLDPWICTSE